MIRRLKQLTSTVVVFGLVTGVVLLVVEALRRLASLVLSQQSDVASAIVTAGATIAVTILSMTVNQWYTRKRTIEEAHRPKKVEAYGSFLDLLVSLMQAVKHGKTLAADGVDSETERRAFQFKKDLILWGSPEVIRSYIGYEQVISTKPDVQVTIHVLDQLLLAMRRDLGNSNRNLKSGQLFQLFHQREEKHA